MQGSTLDAWFTATTAVWMLVTARAAGVCFTAPVLAAPGVLWKVFRHRARQAKV